MLIPSDSAISFRLLSKAVGVPDHSSRPIMKVISTWATMDAFRVSWLWLFTFSV
jgi:hypothetical protein